MSNELDNDQKFFIRMTATVFLGFVLIIAVICGAYCWHTNQMISGGFKLERTQYWGDTYWTK